MRVRLLTMADLDLFFSLQSDPENDFEIGYMVLRDFGGQGLASELARGLSDYAFERFDAPRVIAFVYPEIRKK